MSTLKLPPNHLRSVSASVYLVEKTIDELENMLLADSNHHTYETVNDLTSVKKEQLLTTFQKVREQVLQLKLKYGLNREITYMSRILNARKSRMWEIMSDTTSKRMKGYGDLSQSTATALDEDIKELTELIHQL